MRKIYTLLFVGLLTAMNTAAQTITSFTVTPANPTSNDTVTAIIRCDFTSGSCFGTAYFGGVMGNEISAGGLHCIGTFTVMCTDYDTILIPPLSPGQYSFVFVLQTAGLPACIPGTFPLEVDSVHITVTPATGIEEISNNNFVQIFPNPSSGTFSVKRNANEEALLKIFSAEGRFVKSLVLTNKETEVSFSLAKGVYTASIESGEGRSVTKMVVTE